MITGGHVVAEINRETLVRCEHFGKREALKPDDSVREKVDQ